jgi:hypothetical protein
MPTHAKLLANMLLERLLEVKRACAHCQQELSIRPEPGTSHGQCVRHAIEAYASFLPKEEAERRVAKQMKENPEGFCPDLSKEKAA